MAIQVICPGCMRRFEVSDRFAGKKGPCPKCGNIIEIPKDNVIIHAPDEIIIEGRKVKNPDFVRPIEREPYAFTRRQLITNIVGAILLVAFAYLFHFLEDRTPMKIMAAVLGTFAVAFPIAKYGYIMVRNPDDLEIFLGGELYRRSFFVALGYMLSWFLFELLMLWLNPGFFFFLCFIPVAILASFIPLMVFDTDFGDSLMLYLIFALVMVLLRGLMFMPYGWVWQEIRYSTKEPPVPVERLGEEPKGPPIPKLPTAAPDPSESLKR